jgi:site-specific recombinase XerD
MAGIPRVNERGEKIDIHALRHTYASRLMRNGVGLAQAQRLLGHSDPKLTMAIYTHLGIEDLRGAVESLPPLRVARG